MELGDRREIFFENIDVDNVVGLVGEKTKSFTEENHGRVMGSSNKPKRDSQCFNRPVCFTRIFLNDNRNSLSHRRFL